jgi:hypothetical protein
MKRLLRPKKKWPKKEDVSDPADAGREKKPPLQ